MAEYKLGRIKFVYQGIWQTGYSYVADDVVSVGGRSYICVVAHTSSALFSTDLSANPTKWNLISDGARWTSNWATATYYNAGDLVRYDGIVYLCNTPHTSAATAALGLEADQLKWDIFSTSFHWLGNWATATRYKINDVVTYGADLWICTTYHTSAGSTIDTSKFTILVNGIEFINTWSNATQYVTGDIATYGGYTYVALQNNSNQIPSSSPTYWQPFTTGFSFQGDWNNSTAFKVGSVVRNGGYTYLATADNTNQQPPNASYWSVLNPGFRWTAGTQTYTGLSGTNISGTGSGAVFSVTRSNTTYTVTATSPGTNYATNNQIKILGTNVGGVSPVNDITITVSGVSGGAISSITWVGTSSTWTSGTSYVLGDLVFWGANSYICIQGHTAGSGSRPDNDTSGQYWNAFVFGTEQAVMTTTGDLFYYGTNGPQRLPIGTDGQVLKVVGTTPTWSYYGLINNLVYVGPSGVDTVGNGQGLSIDKPWATIQYACQQVENGYLNTNSTLLMTVNKQFIMKEINNYVLNQYTFNITGTTSGTNTISVGAGTYQATTANMYAGMPIVFTTTAGGITAGQTYYVLAVASSTSFTITAQSGSVTPVTLSTSGTANSGSYSYSQSKTERDTGLLVDGLIYDIGHGGTYGTTTNALSYFTAAGTSYVSGVYSYDIPPFVNALGYLTTLVNNYVLTNTAPATNYQAANGISAGSRAIQNVTTGATIDSGVTSTVTTLVNIVVNALNGGNTSYIPQVITPNTTISIKTGTFNEYLPIQVPRYTALVGDELRSTVVQPAAARPLMVNDKPKTIAAWQRVQSLLSNVVSNTTVTPSVGNSTSQVVNLPAGDAGSTAASYSVATNIALIKNIITNGLSQVPAISLPNPTNYNSTLIDTAYAATGYSSGLTANFGDGRTQIQNNTQFIKDEIAAYLVVNYGTAWSNYGTANQIEFIRNIGLFLDAVNYDITYGGNTQSNIAGSSFYSLNIIQIPSAFQTAAGAALSRLKTVIGQIVTKTAVSASSGNPSTQVVTGTAGSAAASAFAQDRIQNIINWYNNGASDATVQPATSWVSSSLLAAFNALQSRRSEIAADAAAWVYKNYHVQNISSTLTTRDAGLVVDAISYDLMFGSNFASITAGRAYQRPFNTSAQTLQATELAATIGSLTFIRYKSRVIAASGAAAMASVLVDQYIATIAGNALSTAVFNASISGTALTVNSVTSGTITTGMTISGPGIAPNTQIVSGSGSNWVINYSQSVAQTTTTVTSVNSSNNQLTVGTTSGMSAGLAITITGSAIGTLAAGNYYILSVVDSTHITISTSLNGSAYTFAATASGSMTLITYGAYSGLAQTVNVTGTTPNIPVTAVAVTTNQITCATTAGMYVNMPVTFSGLPANITTTASATTSSTNVITLAASASSLGILAGQQIYFTGNVFGTIVPNQLYYVINPSGSTIQVSLTYGGSAVALQTASGTMNVVVNNAGGLYNGNRYFVNSIVSSTAFTITSSFASGSALVITNSVSGMTATATVGEAAYVHGSLTYNNTLTTAQGIEVLRANIPFLAAESSAYTAATYTATVTSTTASNGRYTTSSAHPFVVGDPIQFTGTIISGSGVALSTTYYILSVPTTTTFTLTATQGGTVPVTISSNGSGSMTATYSYVASRCIRDTTSTLNGMIKDMSVFANYRTQQAATLYLSAVNGCNTQNMFLLRNGTGIRNMTLTGLYGALTSANAYGTKRPTAGAYSSLDPGYGPNDSTAWIYARSPYTQNVTMFGTGCTGVKIDASLHNGGNKSIVCNDYTTVISDGIGAWCTGSGSLTELISVFAYYGYAGYLAELGGRIRSANGNSSYGTYGLVAEGTDTFETPLYGNLNNRAFQAQITNVVTDATNNVLRFEYGNAGTNYTNTVSSISGSGYNAAVFMDEFRDSSNFETRIIDLNDGTGVGGTNYVTQTNASQGGATGYVTVAATDLALSNAYAGMRVQLVAGTGVGQYANILTNNNGNKNVYVIRDSVAPLIITSASSTNNLLTVASTGNLYVGMPVYLYTDYAGLTGTNTASGTVQLYYVIAANLSATQFALSTQPGGSAASVNTTAGSTVTVTSTNIVNNLIVASNSLVAGQVVTFNTSFNGILANTPYYVLSSNLSSASFSVSLQRAGKAVSITATGSVSATGTVGTALFAAGWDHVVPGTTIVNALDLTSTYIVEPRISYTSPGFTGTSRTLATSATWTAVDYGAGNFVAVASGGTTTNYSTNGTSWTAGGALPSSQTWGAVVYQGGQGATATAVVGGLGGAGASLTAVVGTGIYAGQIVSVTINNGGYNYTTPPTITFTPTNGGVGAAATCTVLNGAITAVTVTVNGSGYLAAPTVSVITSAVSSITPVTWGKNYYSTPLVTVDYPQGLSPTAWAATTSVSLNAYLVTVDGNIYQVTVAGTTGGTKPTFTSGTAANGSATLKYIATQVQVTANLTNNGVSSFTITNNGFGYTTTPNVTITDSSSKFIAISTASTNSAYNGPTTLGSAWTAGGALPASNFKALAYGNGITVAVGGASGTGSIATTPDGLTWTSRTGPSGISAGYWSAVAYSYGGTSVGPTFVVVNNGGIKTGYSNNGVTWSNGGDLPAGFTSAVSLAYGNGRFVALGSDGKVAYSTTFGTSWTATPTCSGTTTSILSSSLTWTKIVYGQGTFLALASGTTTCATSPDGINWTLQTMPSSSTWTAAVFGNPQYTTIGAMPMFVATANSSTTAASIRTGALPLGRVKVSSGVINEIRMIEPGSGFAKGVVTATTASTNIITVSDTTNLVGGSQIEFTGCTVGGLALNTVYYVIGTSIVANTSFQVSASLSSVTPVTLTTTTGLTGTYRVKPTATIVDPNHIVDCNVRTRNADGALGNPSFTNRGANNSTATATTNGDGYADIYQPSNFIAVNNIYAIPTPGANVQFASIPGTWYKLVAVTNILGTAGNYTAQFQISPSLTTYNAPASGDLITTRLKYSQVRTTGHDYLYIGVGNQTTTNYPNVNPANAIIANQQLASGGGRVFFTSTDQDGNFNVGNLFGVQQATGTATLNASAFNLAGLQSLQLGQVTLGVGSAVITQFSTDPYFTANSDSVVPTQKAIRSYITSQIGGGQSSLNVNTLTSGVIYVSGNSISTTNGNQILVTSKMNFVGGIDGAPVALAFFRQR